jgi:hypothetical protein
VNYTAPSFTKDAANKGLVKEIGALVWEMTKRLGKPAK